MIAQADGSVRRTPPGPVLRVPGIRARRILFATLVLATAGYGVSMMAALLGDGGVTRLESLVLVLFAPTFGWIAMAFWNAVIGFVVRAANIDPLTLQRRRTMRPAALRHRLESRTALVVPARNEDADAVIARIERMLTDLSETGGASAFDVHLLSDTDDPALAVEEAARWASLVRRYQGATGLHYRRRTHNAGRKAGNIAEFLERAGDGYAYMVVLDADSVMSGETLVGLVQTMDANPGAGLLQTVPLPAPQPTRFGHLVELAAGLYAPMLAAGQSFWQGDAANYWGHNAIVRVAPFREHCRLPVLRGSPPMGGEILSHDFVEAALLRRAGWGVYLMADMEGSWEDVPGDLVAYARRDRRWCQGSLQHLRLVALRGLHPLSRLHFALGAMGYVSSLLWLLLLIASTAYVAGVGGVADPALLGLERLGDWTLGQPLPSLLLVTAVLLFLPKALGLLLAFPRRTLFGGGRRLLGLGLREAAFAVLVAPVMMMFHARAVLEVLLGRSVPWSAQERRASGLSWGDASRAAGWITVLGGAWAAATWWLSPMFFLWMAPIFAGLLAAIPLVRWTSRPTNGVFEPGVAPRRSSSEAPESARVREGSMNDMYEAERGLFELRRGRPLYVTHTGNGSRPPTPDVVVASVEGLRTETLETLATWGSGPIHLVVTPHRAEALGIRVGPGPVALPLPRQSSPAEILHLCSAPDSNAPHDAEIRAASGVEAQGLALARVGHLLPAVVAVPVSSPPPPALAEALAARNILRVEGPRIRDALDTPRVSVSQVSAAPVPLRDAEEARFVLFREDNALLEHVAILIGPREDWPDPVPVRLHSACLTGDLFGSLKCDCGEQLRGSLGHFQKRGGGVLLYLQQEGRGIGLGNKLRAYALQDGGLDTVDADCTLGFGPDERSYDAALDMLRHLDIARVQLLTNNPEKLQAVERAGVTVVERMPLHGTLNRHNLPYVKAKVQRAGHWLGDMLSEASRLGS